LAGFVDAGNIWTLRNYSEQPGGQFKFSKFYKEIAMSYGLGLRVDLSFLLLRLDFGMKAYDPSRDEGDRWVIYRPSFKRDFAWHFAIGYPF
jgi:outer membrane protein assembly factor BamA